MTQSTGSEPLLQPEQRAHLEEYTRDGAEDPRRRRARILLLYDQGQPTREVARSVSLSRSCVRYWRAKFRRAGMGIFPELGGSGLPDASLPAGLPEARVAVYNLSPLEPSEGVALQADDRGAPSGSGEGAAVPDEPVRREHVAALALALFDGLQPLHKLASAQRSLLEDAARLALPPLPAKKRDALCVIGEILQAQHPAGLAQEEQDTLVALLALHSGSVKPKALPRLGLSEAQQQVALSLAALLEIASSLAIPGSQDTAIDRVERAPGGWWIVVSGPQAGDAASAAQASAAAWSRAGYPALRVIEAGEAARELEGFAPLPSPQKSAGLLPGDLLSEAGRKLMLFLFAEMLRHEAGTRLGEDIEALHDMRVATRRLRAAFEVFQGAFEPKALKPYLKGLRQTGRLLGQVRDLDVFMEKAQHYLASLPESERQGLDPLLEDWKSQRDRARAQMIEHLDGEDFQAFKWSFNQFLHTPGAGAREMDALPPQPAAVREIAPVLVYTRLSEVRAFDAALPNAPIELLHALRIQFKKLRYTVEFFREVLGEETRAVINDLKSIQDHLGDLNDADVATRMLKTFLEEWDGAQAGLPVSQRQNPEGIVNYLAARHAERYRLMVSFPEAWEYFNRPEFRRSLALAVSVL